MLRAAERSGLVFAKFFGDFVGELFDFAFFELHAFAFEVFNDVVAGVFAFFGGEEETNRSACDGAAYNCQNYV